MSDLRLCKQTSLVDADKNTIDFFRPGDLVYDYYTGIPGIVIELVEAPDRDALVVVKFSDLLETSRLEPGYIYALYIPLQTSSIFLNPCSENEK
jgi:hypothetical protein